MALPLPLPHGYRRNNARWIAVILGLGMFLMLIVATGILWWGLGVPFLLALLLGAIITPTDPVVAHVGVSALFYATLAEEPRTTVEEEKRNDAIAARHFCHRCVTREAGTALQ